MSLSPGSVGLLLIGLACCGTADADEEPFFEELPLVLSASRLPQALADAPGAVTIIDRRTIAATGYRDLARLLRLVAGMQVGQERGHAHWVTYHGLSNDFPTEMQVLIDGRSVISPSAFGGADWSGLPLTLDEIDRIEVVRGTNASGFGANAFLGVVNIITRHTTEERGPGLRVRGGEDRIRDLEAHWSGAAGPLSTRINAVTQRDAGFAGLHDSLRRDTVSLRGDLQLTPRNALMLRASINSGRRSEGYPDSVFGNNGPRDSHQHSHTLHLQWQHARSADEEWLVHYYRNHERIRDEWLASAPAFPAVPLDRNRDSRRDNVEIQHRSAPREDVKLVWGAEARRDEVDSPFFFFSGNPDPQHLHRAFGNLEWRVAAALALNLGGAVEKYSDAPLRVSPRLFANWHVAPTHTLRAGYARAYRQANLFELHGDIRAIDPASRTTLARPYLPNPELEQTRIDSVELGYIGRLPAWNTRLDVRLFNERIRDFIVRAAQPDPAPRPVLADFLGSTRYENLDTPVTLRGIEYQLVAQPRRGTELRLAHSLVDLRGKADAVADRSAPYTASLSWLQDWARGWSSMLSVLHFGPLAGGDGYVPRFRYVAKAYTTVDLTLRYMTRIGPTPVELALTAINLGPRHQEFADRSQQAAHMLATGDDSPVNRVGRSVYLTLSLALD